MKKKEVSKIIAVGLTTSMVLTPISGNIKIVNAQELKSSYKNILSDNEKNKNVIAKEQVYLSDIEYDKNRSSVGYGSIMKDTNIEGGKIKLKVDGEAIEFDKGLGAHATSTIVYDISQYKDTYTRFVSYLGIDASKGDNGDGVLFKIYTSDNGQDWNLVKDTGILKGDKESTYIDIDLNGAKYIKLYAYDNGNNSYDHAVYGDAKLVKSDYTLSNTTIPNLYPVSYYDEILSKKTIEENMKNNQMLILRRAFVNRVGYESIQRLSNKGQKYMDGIKYLLNNETALRYFMTNGPVNVGGTYSRSVQYFCDIYEKYATELQDTKDDNFNLRLAISISLGYSRDAMVTSWLPRYKPVSSVDRYETYKELISSGRMDKGGDQDDYGKWTSKQFKELPIPMMKWVVDSRMNNDEMLWLADYALSEKAKGKNYLDAYNYIEYDYTFGYNYDKEKYYSNDNYDKYKNKYKFDKYYSDYGSKDVNRLWMVFEEGSVCGGLAQTYANLSEVFGRPSSPCGQPAHATSITWGWNKANQRYEWMIQNDILGWVETGNQFDDRMLGWGTDWNDWYNASYTILATDAIYDANNYMEATMLNLLADSYSNNSTKKEVYKKALSHQKINYDSIIGLIECYKNDNSTTKEDYFNLAKEIISNYTYYPQVMMDLLSKIEGKITDTIKIAELDLLKNEALTKASKATAKETSNVSACTQLANHYLGKKNSEVATFSFDGENANKIVLNEKYNDSSIRVRYSLDGGENWTETDKHVIPLTKDEIDSINAENDIIVGLVGTNTTYTIDILPGDTINTSLIYANDNENTLIGKLENLEFSVDNGQTWSDYVVEDNSDTKNLGYDIDSKGRIRFDGDKTVKVRYKANGRKLQSSELVYKFTKNTDTENRKYVKLDNISLVNCSQANSDEHKGENLLDGTPNTGYHTVFGQTTQDKFFTVEFDKVRYITSLEYQSNGYNGKMRSGRVLTSLDGQTWTESGTFDELGYNHNLKTINLKKPTACKYIKIVADKTYGNSEGEVHMYLSGNMLNFYEDTVYEDTAQIDDLATFSFDGENANKIVLNSRYDNSSVKVKYSLDGGKSWTETDKHIIDLTKEEINSINADNNIIVGLVGINATYTIDILPGETINASSIYANDNENTLIGKLENLEFSVDNGQTWSDYVVEDNSDTKNLGYDIDSKGRIRFDGDKTVKVRYKANGRKLQSSELVYKFTKNTDTENRKYVKLDNISLVNCSQANSDEHKGENLLDGTPNTGYHTVFGQTTQDKFFTVEFDKVRYITSLEYQSNGYNGKMRSGRVLTSLDGQTWTESGTFDELGYNHNLKTINLKKPTACKYIKIVADKTYGNTEGEVHMYLSGNMLNFYEDTTQKYIAD